MRLAGDLLGAMPSVRSVLASRCALSANSICKHRANFVVWKSPMFFAKPPARIGFVFTSSVVEAVSPENNGFVDSFMTDWPLCWRDSRQFDES